MALNRQAKATIVNEVHQQASEAITGVIAHYIGLTVDQMTRLRVAARSSQVYLKVVRNTLARRALEGTEFDCMTEALVGPTLLAFSKEDPGAPARLMRDFAKEFEALEVKVLSIGGKLLPANELKAVADLPTFDEAVAKLMGVFKAPVEKFVRTLAEPHTKLVRTIAAVKDAKEAA